MTPLDALKQFEERYDQDVAALQLWTLPLRTVMTGLYMVVDSLFNGHRFGAVPAPRVDAGEALVSRLSYLVPFLLRCPLQPLGSDAANAASALDATTALEILTAIEYAHFSELMPEVHRKQYRVKGSDLDGFEIAHMDAASAMAEERDIVLSEIAVPFIGAATPVATGFDRAVRVNGDVDVTAMLRGVTELYLHFANSTFELPPMTNDGFRAAVGVSWDEFCRFRAAWIAVSEYARQMAAATARAPHAGDPPSEALVAEMMEWVAVLLKSNMLDGMVSALSGLREPELDAVTALFSLEPSAVAVHAGEGFFPPLLRLHESTLFNPDVLRTMTASRNVLYATLKLDGQMFDRHVSHHMEPALIEQAARIISRLAGVEIVTNIDWGAGEFDLLVYQAETNVALHVQAKAPVPPQGARMVAAIERRTIEGLEQLDRVRALSGAERDAILSKALGHAVQGVSVVDAILCRTSIGTHRVWARLNAVAALNLQLLTATADELLRRAAWSLADVPQVSAAILDRIIADVSNGWERTELEFRGVPFAIPLLRLAADRMAKVRKEVFPRDAFDRSVESLSSLGQRMRARAAARGAAPEDVARGSPAAVHDGATAAPALHPSRARVKPGRNERCPCGSGAKYKKCCGR